METGIRLDYKELRAISPKAARQAILQILKSTRGNVAETARLLHTTRVTIYKALTKQKGGSLEDLKEEALRIYQLLPIRWLTKQTVILRKK